MHISVTNFIFLEIIFKVNILYIFNGIDEIYNCIIKCFGSNCVRNSLFFLSIFYFLYYLFTKIIQIILIENVDIILKGECFFLSHIISLFHIFHINLGSINAIGVIALFLTLQPECSRCDFERISHFT